MSKKIALITGGSRGLGQNAALHLADKGVDIVLTYRNAKDAADATVAEIEARGGKAVALQLDTTDTSAFSRFASTLASVLDDTWGRSDIDFLVNNAGSGILKPFPDTTEGDLDRMYSEHVKGPYLLTQRLLPMIADGGRILNVSSGLARFAYAGYSAYGGMKGAIEVITRYMAAELAPRGIAVNVIAPGAIETDFGGGVVRDIPDINKAVASSIAMGRAGLPDDIGEAVAGILTGMSQWMTAQRIEVSGGQNL
ncbi:SDR family oxidoreductase [Rhodospirillaceae bacterium KN72]|uniref:SDR family oxidoreductase n=1 Tax=Pacificispira spongiicola TaxID=2729598 RepID=A0A7Y0E1S0_9PROT|nr:SDR family oxidoreductase [Pacificispira spongiicola]NMM45647.1 SDR family oxidoreductase [Pacificispira spongiicola]